MKPCTQTTIATILAGFVLMAAHPGPAAESSTILPDSAKIARDGHRFLFVVETSSDNRKLEQTTRQTLFDLIMGGVQGQMRTGDTFGIWTFSDDVRTGEFPMSVWDSATSLEAATRAATFLQRKKYSKNPNIPALVRELRLLADRVEDFNVLIISSGREKMVGTPFDDSINAAYGAFVKRPAPFRHLPAVTTFVVRAGRPVRSSVVIAGDRIALPERPPPVAKAPSPTPTNTVAIPRKKVMQIVTRTNPPAATGPLATSAPPATANTTLASAQTPSRPPALPSPAPLAPAGPPGPITNAGPTHNTSLNNGPAPQIAPSPLTPGTTANAPAALNTQTNLPPAIATHTVPPVPPAPPANSPPPVASSSTSSSSPSNDTPGFNVTTVAQILSTAATAAAAAAAEPAPLPVAAREPVSPPASAPASTPAHTPAMPSPETSPMPMAVTAAAAVPVPRGLSASAMMAFGGALLGMACFLLILVLRRTHRPARGSLITQSMRRN